MQPMHEQLMMRPSQPYSSQHYSSLHQQQQQQSSGLLSKITQMIFYLKQQQLSPQLLPYKQRLFNSIKQKIKDQEDSLKKYKKDKQSSTVKEVNYKTVIYSMEVERYSYVLKHYLKIQKLCFYYFKNMALSENLMSKPQLQLLKKYVDMRYKYYQKNVLRAFPKNFKGFGGMQLFLGKPQQSRIINSNQSMSSVQQPDINSYVFMKLNRNPNEFRYTHDMPINQIPQEESKIASPNDIAFIPFYFAKSLMERSGEDDMELV